MMLQFLGNILMISPFPFLEKNQIVVAQNAADDLSPLDCTPECPQVFLYLFNISIRSLSMDYRLMLSRLSRIQNVVLKKIDLCKSMEI